MTTTLATADLEPALARLDSGFAQTLVALPSGARVAVRTTRPAADQAPVIVLLHGIGSGAASWLDVALTLGARANVIAWDAPGYGESSPLESGAPSAADYAQRLHELLIALRVDACVLVGHSLGALIATAYASALGRRVVRRLVLISPARGYGTADRADERAQVLEKRLRTLRERGVAGIAEDAPRRMLSADADAAARAWVQWNAARLNAAGYTQAVRMLCRDDIVAHAPPAMPLEVHCGAADSITPPESCRDIAAHFGVPLALIAQAGHASPVEQPRAVARLIADAASIDLGDEQP